MFIAPPRLAAAPVRSEQGPSASPVASTSCQSPEPAAPWFVYILRCRDNSLYTGITTDLDRRLREHNSPRGGSKYTRSRQPVHLVYREKARSRSQAARLEYQIKKLSTRAKELLVATSSSRHP